MNGAFYVGATGLQAQQRALEVVANNISNINTMGFKRSEVRFAELVGGEPSAEMGVLPLARPATLAVNGVQMREAVRIFQQGALRETGKPFDIAISGDGFIELLGPGGETWLWRGGTLRVNADGLLETESGLALKAVIEVPEDSTDLRIDRDGVVRSLSVGQDKAEEIGTISLVMPRDPELVEAMGSGFYRVPDDGELETVLNGQDGGVIVQGSLEASNVELTNEMVSLLLLQRAYAANAQAVQAGDQLMSIANNLRR